LKVAPEDYDRMRAWYALISREVLGKYITPETDPVAALDQLAATSPSKARQGLSMAIGDLVEMTSNWSNDQVAAADEKLSADQLPTLSEVRARFSKAVRSVVRRGHIENDVEYYAVRNAAELSRGAEDLWKLLAAYEASGSGVPTV
jgi:hypothetical protein